MKTRFAPSPTGDLHLGGAWTALASWALARASGGRAVLRIEDIDMPRVVNGSAERIVEDLAWLGLDWDEGPFAQSARTRIYEAAIAKLTSLGLAYPCDCSRAEIARVASAPHPGEELVYPGTCRGTDPRRELKRPPAIRLRVPEHTTIAFDDLVHGRVEQRVDSAVGDFVLRRGDGVFAYQLVVAVDDAEGEITHVVRADDLLASTPRQILLMRLLGHRAIPAYAHVPLVIAPSGERLAKRGAAPSVRDLRSAGVPSEEIVGALAHGLGLVAGERRPMTPRDVARQLTAPSAWRKAPQRADQIGLEQLCRPAEVIDGRAEVRRRRRRWPHDDG